MTMQHIYLYKIKVEVEVITLIKQSTTYVYYYNSPLLSQAIMPEFLSCRRFIQITDPGALSHRFPSFINHLCVNL